MLTYQCAHCGSAITVEDHERIGQCPVCQSIFVFPNQYATKQNLYKLAADALRARNFDVALTYYGRILKVDAIETAAHWGYLLSKYGIEISTDLRSMGQILFHRVEHSPFTDDPSYEKMLTYCPAEARYYYEGLSRQIVEKQRKLFALAANVGEYDVYINCVERRGSADYLLANQVGKALDDAGYRVFLPCTMLSNVPEAEKNLYEMAVAEKAKSMIVVVTKGTGLTHPRYQAVWKRYLAYRRQDAGRKMLSVYQEIDPEQLPLELQPLQSMECGGLDFQDKVLAEINKMFGRQNRSVSVTREILEELRQGQLALDNQRFDEAAGHFRHVRELDAEEKQAHWGLFCAATHNLTKAVLHDEVDNHYQRALQFSEGKQREDYRQAASAVMTDAAWNELKKLTENFKKTSVNGTAKVEAAIQRVYLYMPRNDARLAEIERYHEKTKMDREAADLIDAYRKRDTVVQPLFVDQKKAESEYKEVDVEDTAALRASLRLERVTTLSLFALIAAQVLMVWHFNQTTGYEGSTYVVARILFLIGLGALVIWFGELSDSWMGTRVPGLIVGAILAAVTFFISRKTTRIVYLLVILVPAILLIIQRVRVLLVVRNVKASLQRKKKALKKLQKMDETVAEAYRKHMKDHYTKYGEPNHTFPEYQVPHDPDVNMTMARVRLKNPVMYILMTVVIYAVAIFGTTAVSNWLYARNWKDVVSISSCAYHTAALIEDGTVVANGLNRYGQCNVETWTDIVQVEAGYSFVAGLKADGTVVVAGGEGRFEEVNTWRNVKKINASHDHLVGWKADGTLVAAGSNGNGECEVDDYTNVVKFLANTDGTGSLTVVLMEDGSVRITPKEDWENIAAWVENHTGSGEDQNKVVDMIGEAGGILLVYEDGSVQGIGSDYYHQLSQAEDWDVSEMIDLYTADFTVGIQKNGRAVFAGNNKNAKDQTAQWSDLTDLSGGYSFVVGLKSDGTAVAAGNNQSGQCDVEHWENVKEIYTGHLVSYGITEDNDVVSAGYSISGLTYTQNKNPLELLSFWIEALRW